MLFVVSCLLLVLLQDTASLDLRKQHYTQIIGKQIIGEVIDTSRVKSVIACGTACLQQSGVAYNVMNTTVEEDILCEIIGHQQQLTITNNTEADYYCKLIKTLFCVNCIITTKRSL